MDILTEGINVRKWIKAIEKGEDVVVYDKKGKRYNLQGGGSKDVQVTDHWKDLGGTHPEKTWQTIPLSKVKKIVIEGVISEGPDYVVKIEDRKGKLIQRGSFTFKDDANKYIKDMVKKHKLKRQKGFWANPKTGVELVTNF